MRLYIQLIPNNETRAHCLEWQKITCQPLERRYRLSLIEENQLHLTLAEVRTISEKQISDVQMDITSLGSNEISTHALTVDWFPSIQQPSVIAVNLHLNGELANIYSAVRDKLNSVGITATDRPIRPHITLARVNQNHISAQNQLPLVLEENTCTFKQLRLVSR